jgi:hypothetical protein
MRRRAQIGRSLSRWGEGRVRSRQLGRNQGRGIGRNLTRVQSRMLGRCGRNRRWHGLAPFKRRLRRNAGRLDAGIEGRSHGGYTRRNNTGSHSRVMGRSERRDNRRALTRIKSWNERRIASRCLRRVARGCGSRCKRGCRSGHERWNFRGRLRRTRRWWPRRGSLCGHICRGPGRERCRVGCGVQRRNWRGVARRRPARFDSGLRSRLVCGFQSRG